MEGEEEDAFFFWEGKQKEKCSDKTVTLFLTHFFLSRSEIVVEEDFFGQKETRKKRENV